MNRSEIFIFIGPTITLDDAKQHLDATYLPPVKYGDVYRIVELYQPKMIGIIDGFFNQVPAVWHKEILWAMNQNINVFGAASMGALRAAELDAFGMKGYGKIYEAYSSGVLAPYIDETFEDDDEVAVVHGPAELGYKQASEAMVNIRFTFSKALQQQVIDTNELKNLTTIAKSLFYPQRNYTRILDLAGQEKISDPKSDQLKNWFDDNKVDQKQLDAKTMLFQMHEFSKNSSQPDESNTSRFEHTSQWQTAISEIEESHDYENPVLNEVRLTGESYFELLDDALSSNLINHQHTGVEASINLSDLHHCPSRLDKIYAESWQMRSARSTANLLSASQCDNILLQHLEKTGKLTTYSERAENKKDKLTKLVNKPTIDELNELDQLQLSDWYFSEHLKTDLPDEIDHYVSELGFTDTDDFYDMILKEYYFVHNNN